MLAFNSARRARTHTQGHTFLLQVALAILKARLTYAAPHALGGVVVCVLVELHLVARTVVAKDATAAPAVVPPVDTAQLLEAPEARVVGRVGLPVRLAHELGLLGDLLDLPLETNERQCENTRKTRQSRYLLGHSVLGTLKDGRDHPCLGIVEPAEERPGTGRRCQTGIACLGIGFLVPFRAIVLVAVGVRVVQVLVQLSQRQKRLLADGARARLVAQLDRPGNERVTPAHFFFFFFFFF